MGISNPPVLQASSVTSAHLAVGAVSGNAILPRSVQTVDSPANIPFTLSGIWFAQPQALTEIFGTTVRTKVDLTNVTQCRVQAQVQVAGAAGANLQPQFSYDQAQWGGLAGPSLPSIFISGIGLQVSPWLAISGIANGDVFMRLVGTGGALTNVALGPVSVQVR